MARRHYTCATCYHYGCCDRPCGGTYWTDGFTECVRCGARIRLENSTTIYDDPYCTSCAEAKLDEMEREEAEA